MSETSVVRALVVDDEAFIRETVIEFLWNEFALSCEEASCGNDAIQLLQKEVFDLIVCDFKMANGTGLDVHHFLRERSNSRTYFILHTADISFSDEGSTHPFPVVPKMNFEQLAARLESGGFSHVRRN